MMASSILIDIGVSQKY